MISRVRAPPLICSTHCCHPLSWNKHWITHEQYHSSLSCVLIWFNGAISRRSGITTVNCRGEMESNSLENYPVIYNPRYCRITTMGWRKKGDSTKLSRYAAQRCSLHAMPYWNVNASLLQPHLVYKTLMSLSVCLAYTLLNHTSNKPWAKAYSMAIWSFHCNIPMAGMVTIAALLLPLQLVATILTVCITL